MPKGDRVMTPRVSVVMASFNRDDYLRQAIDSILNQSFPDFEFIIVDDGSAESTRTLLRDYARRDPRIVLVLNESNMRHARSLNKGLALARGQYIARMDSDDIALPMRLARQVAFMDANPQVGICGSWIQYFGTRTHLRRTPPDDATIRCALFFHSAIIHPSAMFRRQLFVDHNLAYNVDFTEAEDYELWVRAAQVTTLANVPQVLLHYRSHGNQTGTRNREVQVALADSLRLAQLARFGLPLTEEEQSFHLRVAKLTLTMMPMTIVEIDRADRWLQRLVATNQIQKVFPEPMFSDKLREQWYLLCSRATHLNLVAWIRYWQSPLRQLNKVRQREHAKFLVHCAWPWLRETRRRQALQQAGSLIE